MATTVRKATQQDIGSMFRLCVSMHEETDFRHFRLDPEKMLRNLAAWVASPRHLCLIAERDGLSVGLLLASTRDPWFSNDLLAAEDLFYVEAEHRGSRAGYLLISALMEWVEHIGAAHVRAGAATGIGDAAERLYEHVGMHPVGSNFSMHTNGGTHVLR